LQILPKIFLFLIIMKKNFSAMAQKLKTWHECIYAMWQKSVFVWTRIFGGGGTPIKRAKHPSERVLEG